MNNVKRAIGQTSIKYRNHMMYTSYEVDLDRKIDYKIYRTTAVNIRVKIRPIFVKLLRES